MPDTTLLQSIHSIDQEIGATKNELKKIKEAIDDEVLQLDIYKALQDAREQVTTLQQQLKSEIQSSPDISKLVNERGELQFKLKDQKEILSHHLLQYTREHEDTQLPLEDGKHAKQIIMSARLSAKEAFYQEPLRFEGAKK